MNTETNTATVMTDEQRRAAELEAIEAALASEFGDEISLDADDTQPVDDSDIAAAVGEIELSEARSEAYAEAGAGEPVVSTEPVEKKARGKKAKAEKPPRVTLTGAKNSVVIMSKLGENPNQFFIVEAKDDELDADGLEAKRDEMLAIVDKMAKKVGEKAVNLYSFMSGHAKLSVYTEHALNFLFAKGECTAKELIEHLHSGAAGKPYSLGTARSQGHQMFQLLPALKIATLDGKTMKVNADSVYAATVRDLLTK